MRNLSDAFPDKVYYLNRTVYRTMNDDSLEDVFSEEEHINDYFFPTLDTVRSILFAIGAKPAVSSDYEFDKVFELGVSSIRIHYSIQVLYGVRCHPNFD